MKKIIFTLSMLFFTASYADELTIPNDPFFAEQWGLFNPEYGVDIDVLEAWEIEKGSKNVAIVLLGTGIDYTHPDLIKNVWTNPGEIAGDGVDNDNNGYIDDIHGINAITGSGDPIDDQGHETHIAGIIGAEVNNGIGIAGVMHDVSLIACKFLDVNGSGTINNAIKCLDYVAGLARRDDTGVTIIATVNAWGGGSFSDALYDAIKKQRDLGVIFITTSGNGGVNLDEHPGYLASYDLSNMIVVNKVKPDGHFYFRGGFGANTVHLSAPGFEILGTHLNGGYKKYSGSSAVGFVAGVLGLIKSHYPYLGWAQLKHRLLAGTKSLPFEKEDC